MSLSKSKLVGLAAATAMSMGVGCDDAKNEVEKKTEKIVKEAAKELTKEELNKQLLDVKNYLKKVSTKDDVEFCDEIAEEVSGIEYNQMNYNLFGDNKSSSYAEDARGHIRNACISIIHDRPNYGLYNLGLALLSKQEAEQIAPTETWSHVYNNLVKVPRTYSTECIEAGDDLLKRHRKIHTKKGNAVFTDHHLVYFNQAFNITCTIISDKKLDDSFEDWYELKDTLKGISKDLF